MAYSLCEICAKWIKAGDVYVIKKHEINHDKSHLCDPVYVINANIFGQSNVDRGGHDFIH